MKANFITKSTILFIVFTFCLNLHAQQPVLETQKIEKIIRKNDFQVKPRKVSLVAQKAIQRGVKPGTFQNVTYTYNDNVATLTPQIKNKVLNTISNNSTIKTNDYKNLDPNKIYIDESSDLVLQAGPITDKELLVYKPKFEEVFQDFNLPLQTVDLTIANTSETIEGSEVSDKQTGADYDMMMSFDDTEYTFDDEVKNGNTTSKIEVKVKLNGFIGFNHPKVEASYTKNNGYRLVFKAKEQVDLKIESNLEFSSLTRIPVWGFDIPAGKIGNCKIGVFAVIDIDGKVNLEVEINQGINFEAGVRGKTLYYFPRSVKTVNNTTSYCNVDYEIEGEIKAFGGIECVAEIKVKGYDILRLRGKAGIETNVKTTNNGKNFDADIGFRLVLDGKVKKINKDFTLLDKYFIIWEKTEKNYGGYTFIIKEADAYFDRVHGVIFNRDSLPYKGDLTLNVIRTSKNKSYSYEGQTNDQGVFALTGIELIKGDKVNIKIPDSPNPSESVYASIPFKELKLYYADYYTDKVEGVVNGKINAFPKTTTNTTSVANSNTNIPKPSVIVNSNTSRLDIIPKMDLDINMFKNSITYSGNVQIIIEPTIHYIEKKIPALNTVPKTNTPKNKALKVKGVSKIEKPKADLNIPKAKNLKVVKVTNKPFGNFEVSNLIIKPHDKVKARINIDGFILESNWVMADGLVFSQIHDAEIEGGIFKSTIASQNSWMFVSALRSDKDPQGEIRLLKGIDMKHSSEYKKLPIQPSRTIKLAEFSEAKHPLVYFNKTVSLEKYFAINTEFSTPQTKGLSIAKTGNWSVNNIYYNPKDMVSISRKYGHPFEYINYVHDGVHIIKKYYQEQCNSCDAVDYNKLFQKQENTIPNQQLNQGMNKVRL